MNRTLPSSHSSLSTEEDLQSQIHDSDNRKTETKVICKGLWVACGPDHPSQ